ncbi:chemical-damaging agent resistance protein C [Flexivirga endophytica]|uniref:Chemical-damaging agent resistance protein C n=1 Tax=Flexivirga endophytica TaxID=1849103 RepID=A0A916WWJ8_9MICO|nr:TerD family protein [Flexivirga endophytica]GGB35595.1 chemical-damaging agent resistance protein C [Flexivirga endophytica]GHB43318.1 chemical-damaging agent resistance protein C [Flexivirga endophytica]
MPVNLSKGANISLEKAAPGMTTAIVGLGWNPRTTDGAQFDLDASVLLLAENGKVRNQSDFVFYNNLTGDNGSVQHLGDNRTGEGEGDDEQIKVTLGQVSPDVQRIAFVASIDQADARGQNFGQVSDAFIRIFDADDPSNNDKGARFDLGEDAATESALVFGELYRNGAEWKFRAVGQGYSSGLAGVIKDFGLDV